MRGVARMLYERGEKNNDIPYIKSTTWTLVCLNVFVNVFIVNEYTFDFVTFLVLHSIFIIRTVFNHQLLSLKIVVYIFNKMILFHTWIFSFLYPAQCTLIHKYVQISLKLYGFHLLLLTCIRRVCMSVYVFLCQNISQLSSLYVQSFYYCIYFHFISFFIWFNFMWSIRYLFFHHLTIYLLSAYSLEDFFLLHFHRTSSYCLVFRCFCMLVCHFVTGVSQLNKFAYQSHVVRHILRYYVNKYANHIV